MLYILYIKWCAGGCGLHGVQMETSLTGCVAQVISGHQKINFLTLFDSEITFLTLIFVF